MFRGDDQRRVSVFGALLAGILGGAVGAVLMLVTLGGVRYGESGWEWNLGREPTNKTPGLSVEVVHPVIEVAGGGGSLEDAVAISAAVGQSIAAIQAHTEGASEVKVGSGIVIETPSGVVVVTNNHVISGTDRVEVVLSDTRIYDAEIAGRDPETDLAVLRITGEDLIPITVGESDNLAVGAPVVAVGNPGGLGGWPAVTTGVLAGKDRKIGVRGNELYGMLQISAGISQGSSGGALVDRDGHLVGVTTAVSVDDPTNLGFAIPVEVVMRVAANLAADGRPRHGRLGADTVTTTMVLGDGGELPVGVQVVSVREGGPAAAAGIQVGEVIAAVDGAETKTPETLIGRLYRYNSGDQVKLRLLSVGDGHDILSERDLTVTLGAREGAE